MPVSVPSAAQRTGVDSAILTEHLVSDDGKDESVCNAAQRRFPSRTDRVVPCMQFLALVRKIFTGVFLVPIHAAPIFVRRFTNIEHATGCFSGGRSYGVFTQRSSERYRVMIGKPADCENAASRRTWYAPFRRVLTWSSARRMQKSSKSSGLRWNSALLPSRSVFARI